MAVQVKEHPYTSLYPPHRVRLTEDDIDHVHAAMDFIRQFDPLAGSPQENEMIIMHLAFLVNPNNEFINNSNIRDNRLKHFIEHVDMMTESDINAWCRKLYEFNFWKLDNFVTVNIVWNWLRGTLVSPTPFL